MASAYATPASPDYHSAKMLDGVERGLQRWYKGHPISDNWWDNTIGEPLLLSRTLVPLEDVLPADLLRQGVELLCGPHGKRPHRIPALPLSYPQQQLIRGVLMRSAEDVAAASEAMQRIIRIRTDEGIQRDFSFHQHGPQLYNGGYGLTLMVDMINYATVLRGTRYAFAPEKLIVACRSPVGGQRAHDPRQGARLQRLRSHPAPQGRADKVRWSSCRCAISLPLCFPSGPPS